MEPKSGQGHLPETVTFSYNNGTVSESEAFLGDKMDTSVTSVQEQLKYALTDSPPWYACMFIGLQHFITMFFSQVGYATIVASAFCMKTDLVNVAQLISSMLFCAGINTVLQTLIGSRLPIVQGSSASFLAPIFATLSLPKWKCSEEGAVIEMHANGVLNSSTTYINMSLLTNSDKNLTLLKNLTVGATSIDRIREISGALIVAGLFEMAISILGIMGLFLRFMTPLVITVVITYLGIPLIPMAIRLCATCWPISTLTIILVGIFSQCLKKINIPMPGYNKQKKCHISSYPIFLVLPILLSVLISWFICYILTATKALGQNPTDYGYAARTDLRNSVIQESSWVRIPYPLQWGFPTFSAPAAIGMICAIMASAVESVGDYYTCARFAHVATPPVHAVNRGIAAEGFGVLLNGLVGTGIGCTSYSTNIAVISLTKVASRKVVLYAAVWMLLFGLLSKFAAIFTTIPEAIIGGITMVYVGMLMAAGLSNLQFVNLKSSRNMFVLGMALSIGLALPQWMSSHPDSLQTGSTTADQILTVLLKFQMLLGGLVALVLDNLLPGGSDKWRNQGAPPDGVTGDSSKVYDFPCGRRCQRYTWMNYIPVCPTYKENMCECCTKKDVKKQDIICK